MDLSGYLNGGELDSQGRFTMDPRRARELLREYSLPEPHLYALSLVSFLVGAGARAVRVQAEAERLEIIGEGLVLPRELLANPLEGLFSGREQPALRELALGMNAALAGAASVSLRSGGREGRYGLEFVVGEFPGEETGFVVEQRPTRELEAIAQAFRECPVEVWVQGSCVSRAPTADENCLALDLGWGLGEHPACHRLEHPAPLRALFSFEQGGCNWLRLGRVYPTPLPFQLDGLPLRMWVDCPALERDLSLQSVLPDARMVAYLRAQLLRGLDETLELFLAGWRPLPVRPVVVWALERAAAGGQPELARELQRALGVVTAVDQLRLDLLEGRVVGEVEGCDLGEAARAFLAIRGVRHYTTSRLLYRAGEQAYVAEDYHQAASFFAPYLSMDPPRSEEVRAQHGHCLLVLGQLQEARYHLTLALRAAGNQRWALTALENLAAVDAGLGYPKEACQRLVQVLARRQALVGSHSPELRPVLRKLMKLCSAMGDAKAVAQYRKWNDTLAEPGL